MVHRAYEFAMSNNNLCPVTIILWIIKPLCSIANTFDIYLSKRWREPISAWKRPGAMGGSGKWMESSGQQQVSEAAECQRLMWLPETFKNRQNSQTGNDTSLFFHCSSSLARSHTQAHMDTSASPWKLIKEELARKGKWLTKHVKKWGGEQEADDITPLI